MDDDNLSHSRFSKRTNGYLNWIELAALYFGGIFVSNCGFHGLCAVVVGFQKIHFEDCYTVLRLQHTNTNQHHTVPNDIDELYCGNFIFGHFDVVLLLYYAMWTAVQFNQFWSIRRCLKLSCCSIHNLLACSFICLWKLWNDTLLALGWLQIKRLIILLFTSGTNCVPLRVNKHRSAALDACMYCSLHSICVTMWAV